MGKTPAIWRNVKRSAQLIVVCLIFLFGLFWQILAVIGQADVFMKLPHFVDELQKFVIAHQEFGYQIAPWVLMVASVVALVLMQWSHLFWNRHNALHGSAPKIKVTVTSLTEPKAAIGRALRTMRIEVENESTLHLKNCSVREAKFVNRFRKASGMRRHFQLNEETYADMATHTYRKTFDLRGKGSTEIINIALLDETKDDSPVVMLYATEPTAMTRNAIPREMFPHVLTISITSDNLLIAEKRTYQLCISDDGILEMISV
jgi:hypothetical protein